MAGIDMRNKDRALFKYFENYINFLNSLYSWIQKKIIIFLYLFFGTLSVISFATLFYVMFSNHLEIMFFDSMTIQKLLGTENKKETIQFIGFGISGLIGFIAVISLTRRSNALDEQNKLVEKGHAQDRFKLAIDHLGNINNQTIRIASFYELYNLACDNENLRQDILEVLCAHLRKTTRTKIYQNSEAKDEPTEEMQSLLDVLFKKQKNTLGYLSANLQKIYLVGANLDNAHLENANLSEARLENAILSEAHLENANLSKAHLENANLSEAHLENALLSEAHLENANLSKAHLENANLSEAHLENANLSKAHLENANLSEAHLENALLSKTHLKKAILIKANLKGAYLINTDLEHADLFWAKLNAACLDGTNLKNASIGRADLYEAQMSESTKMPDGWEKDVRRMPDGTINEPHGGSYT